VIRQETHVKIDRPAAGVYDFVVTHYVENHPKFDPDTVLTELDGGGPIAQGKTGREVRKQMGRQNTYTFSVTELTTNHVTFAAQSGSMTFGAVWSVEPEGSGSDLGMTFDLSFGMPLRLIEPLMGGSVRKQMLATGQRIKSMLESGQPG
jgi:hypothetical protein